MSGAGVGRARTRRGTDEPVQRITTAATPLGDDMADRTRRYLIQMGIRVACFIGVLVIDHPVRWVLLVGAVVIPYVAVLLANAGRGREADPGTFLEAPALPARPRGEEPQEPGR